jgi:hypothetical protein
MEEGVWVCRQRGYVGRGVEGVWVWRSDHLGQSPLCFSFPERSFEQVTQR